MALAGATVRRPIESALDLGTGCGIQALLASAHSERVVASDVEPAGGRLATLTMELNGVGNVEVRTGDLFDPVAGETFELVVANPPFVISPSERYLFRDGAQPVDELCRTLVRSAPPTSTGAGHFQCLASWAHVAGEDWRDRLAGWFAGTGCDALVLEREALDPAAHAANWLRQTEAPDRWEPEYDRWMAYYERHRIEAIGLGLVTMRRRAGGTAGSGPRRHRRTSPCRAATTSARCSSSPTSSTPTKATGSPPPTSGSRPTSSSTSGPSPPGRVVGDRPAAAPDRRAVPGGRRRRGGRRHRRRLRRLAAPRRHPR